MLGRCFSLTDLTLRHRCRISNLFAGGISSPKSPSNGPAVLTGIFPLQGRPLSIQPAARLVAGSPGWMPRGGATSPRRRRAPIAYPGRADSSRQHTLDGRHPGGGVLGRRHPFLSRENLSLTLRRQPASDALREVSEALPCVGSLHGPNLGASHARKAVNPCRELGNVCRA